MQAVDPLSAMSNFALAMLGLSVATERVTETVKQWICPVMNPSGAGADRYAAVIQTIAILAGVLVTACSGLNPLNMPSFVPYAWNNPADWLCWGISGVLVSGGSAVWNHVLDILRAAKVQKEMQVNSETPARQTLIPA